MVNKDFQKSIGLARLIADYNGGVIMMVSTADLPGLAARLTNSHSRVDNHSHVYDSDQADTSILV